VKLAKPFWVQGFKEDDEKLGDGHLFRRNYPLRISVGCKGKCVYCTINQTRGNCYELEPNVEEFLSFEDTLLIADSPSVELLKKWMDLAEANRKPISIRNVEPQVALQLWTELQRLATNDLLDNFHCPIQSTQVPTLKAMRRNVPATLELMERVARDELGETLTATNLIVDFPEGPPKGRSVYSAQHDPAVFSAFDIFDYVSWNPFWDGRWDRQMAEQRWRHYLGRAAK
jgi:hypothetical protein